MHVQSTVFVLKSLNKSFPNFKSSYLLRPPDHIYDLMNIEHNGLKMKKKFYQPEIIIVHVHNLYTSVGSN